MDQKRDMRMTNEKYLKTGAGNRVLFLFVSFGELEREESVGVACVRIYRFRITVLIAPDYGC
jgi:hypothetical protein